MIEKKIPCLVVLDDINDVRYIFVNNVERDCGLHNAGISPEKYKELKWKTVIGYVTYPIAQEDK